MAAKKVFYIDIDYDYEFQRFNVRGDLNVPAQPDDIVQLRVSGGTQFSVYFDNFSNGFTKTTEERVTPGNYTNRPVKATNLSYVRCRMTVGSHSQYFVLDYVSQRDDYFDGSWGIQNKTNQDPKTEISVGGDTVDNVNTEMSWKITSSNNSATVKVNFAEYWGKSGKMAKGDKFYVKCRTPEDYNQTVSYTLTIGSKSVTRTVKTKSQPDIDQLIYMPKDSGGLTMRNITDFFGTVESQPAFSSYYRGGGLVPNITQNNAIPTSGQMGMADFNNAATGFYFHFRPGAKSGNYNTLDSSQSGTLVWTMNDDFSFGFGSLADDVEIRYVLNQTSGSVSLGGDSRTSKTSWSKYNTFVKVSASASRGQEKICQGTLTLYARNKFYPSKEISQTFHYSLNFYGN